MLLSPASHYARNAVFNMGCYKYRERGTGNRERESGNECTAATLLRVQNGGQNKRKGSKKNNLGKGEFPLAVPPDGQYIVVTAESD